MKIISNEYKISKKFIFFSFLVGFITMSVTSYASRTFYLETDKSYLFRSTCEGIESYFDATIQIKIGVPLSARSKNQAIKIPNCPSSDGEKPELSAYSKEYIASWQLYVNWLVWSVACLGILSLARRTYENNRH